MWTIAFVFPLNMYHNASRLRYVYAPSTLRLLSVSIARTYEEL